MNLWTSLLEQGLSRNQILNHFVFGDEFRLYMTEVLGGDEGKPENNLVNDFYRGFQDRLPETDGMNSWAGMMREAMATGEQAVRDLSHQMALDFLQSEEYISQNKSDTEFLEDLYDAVLRRGAQKEEIEAWINSMNAGLTREQVLQEFTNSNEFQARVQAIIEAAGL